MKKYLFGAALIACLFLIMGTTTAQIPIDDIQDYNADGTVNTNAPYWGQVVTVEGVIYVVIGTYNNGTHYIQGASGGINFYDPGAPPLTYGDRVQVTGTVTSFQGEINIDPTTITPISIEPEPEPYEVAIGDLLNPSDYEQVGNLIFCIGTVVNKWGGSPGSSGGFDLFVGTDTLEIYKDSDADIDLGSVDDGDVYKVIGPCVNFSTTIEIKPRRQTDLIEDPLGDPAPFISEVNCENWSPETGDPIQVTAIITDNSAIVSANLYYRDDNGDSTGTFTQVAMINTGGDNYAVTIPAPHPERQVDFYLDATDDGAQTTVIPGNAPAGWYEVAIGLTSIFDLQYVDPNEDNQTTPYLNRVLNIQGIVTAGTGDAGPSSRFILQEYEPDPNYDPRWMGVLVYEGTGANFVVRGDLVKIGGYGGSYFGLTEMVPHNGTAVYIESFGNDLPPPVYENTRVLADRWPADVDGNGFLGEAYESVWIRTKAAAVMDTTDFAEYIISDTGARADSCEVEPEVPLTYQPIIDDVVIIEGYMDYDFGAFQITPIADNFVISGLVGVEDWTPQVVQPAGGFTGIVPNPFNPKAEIRFVLTRDNLAQLNIYDIRGQLVRTLVSERLPAQEHSFFWDGTDLSGQRVSSGTYFARLRIGAEVMQVRKLMLVK